MIKKIAILGALVCGIFGITAGASAAIVEVPTYTDVINATSTAFAQGLVTDLLPWAAVFAALSIGALALVAIYRKVVGAAGRLFGAGKSRRRGRRRR